VHAEERNKNKKCMLKEGIQKRSTYVLLVFIPSFSMYFLFLFLPSACTSCFYSFLQHALLVFNPSFGVYFLFLKQEVHAGGRNKNKKCMLKEGIKTRSTC
jgi:hypothetical protein